MSPSQSIFFAGWIWVGLAVALLHPRLSSRLSCYVGVVVWIGYVSQFLHAAGVRSKSGTRFRGSALLAYSSQFSTFSPRTAQKLRVSFPGAAVAQFGGHDDADANRVRSCPGAMGGAAAGVADHVADDVGVEHIPHGQTISFAAGGGSGVSISPPNCPAARPTERSVGNFPIRGGRFRRLRCRQTRGYLPAGPVLRHRHNLPGKA